MRLLTIAIASIAAVATMHGGTIEFVSTGQKVLRLEAPAASGLEAIYVANGVGNIGLTYTPDGPMSGVQIMRYSSLGGGYAEPIEFATASGQAAVKSPEGNMGYIIDDGTTRTCFWLVDYSTYRFDALGLTPSAETDCVMQALEFEGRAGAIDYYSVNGRRMTLSRELTVDYTTLVFDEGSYTYQPRQVAEVLEEAEGTIHVPAAFCPTTYTLTGDRFLRLWGEPEETVESALIEPYAVECQTRAEQEGEQPENQSGGITTGLGGSAPATVTFTAAMTDAAIFTEWQISTTPDFEDITYRDNRPEMVYTFEETGTRYVRFVCDNASGGCQQLGTTYDISIGESSLLCPNVFSPGTSEGVNDEWKVSYRSLVSFQCTIFNRWGEKMASFSDPSQGWDGRYRGKLVPAGVYYYVIKARGSDGIDYDLAGDINIIGYK